MAAVRVTALYWGGSPSLFLRMKSGIWVALAWDAAHGEVYRPVISAAGYGGTRYMPLLFLLHAATLRAGFDPIWSGVVLMHVSVAMAAVAVYCALRSFDVDRAIAAPVATMVWGTIIFQQSCTDLSPDYVAAALALGAAIANPIGAALLITLAALTKITAAAFILPIALTWPSTRDRSVFLIGVVLCLGASFMAIDGWSGGNFHRAFVAAAFAGTTWRHAIDAVPHFVRELAIKPFDIGVPVVVATWCAWRLRREWPAAYLATAALVAIAIFITPGTASNHLVDLHMASLVVIGVALTRGALRPRVATSVFALAATMIVAVTIPVPGLPSVAAEIRSAGPRSRDAVAAIQREVPEGVWLSIDASVPVLSGRMPWVLDYSNLELAYADQNAIGRDVTARIHDRFFSAVIVPTNYESPLVDLVKTAYVPRASTSPFTIFVPR